MPFHCSHFIFISSNNKIVTKSPAAPHNDTHYLELWTWILCFTLKVTAHQLITICGLLKQCPSLECLVDMGKIQRRQEVMPNWQQKELWRFIFTMRDWCMNGQCTVCLSKVVKRCLKTGIVLSVWMFYGVWPLLSDTGGMGIIDQLCWIRRRILLGVEVRVVKIFLLLFSSCWLTLFCIFNIINLEKLSEDGKIRHNNHLTSQTVCRLKMIMNQSYQESHCNF